MSAPRIAVVVCVLALIGVLAWKLATGDATPEREPAGMTAAASPAPVESRPETRERADAVEPIRARRFAEAGGEEPESAPVAAAAAGDGRKLRVVLAPQGEPAPGAAVAFTPVAENGTTPRGPATNLVADAEGIARLPKFKGFASVRGVLGTTCGNQLLASTDLTGFKLQLFPSVAARVIDARGQPREGVPVVVVGGAPWRPVIDRAPTGADGIARLSAREFGGPKFGEPTQPKIGIGLPLDEPVEVAFDPEKLPETPIDLVLPDTGRLTVKLVTASGQPFLEPALVQVQSLDTEHGRLNDEGPDVVRVMADSGIAVFSAIGLRPNLEILAQPADPALRTGRRELDGPRPAGEHTVTLVLGGRATRVAGRLVNPAGKVLRRTQCSILLPAATGARSDLRDANRTFVMTQPDGRFSARFDVDPETVTPTELVLSVTREVPGAHLASTYVDRSQEIRTPLPDAVRTGSVDLGDVLVPDLDLVASGIVVNDKGPVMGAKVVVMKGDGRGWSQWFQNGAIETVSGLDGRFEIRGALSGSGFALAAERDGWLCLEPAPFAAGDREVKVVLARSGGLEGAIKGLEPNRSLTWTQPPVAVSVVKAGASAPWTGRYEYGTRVDSDRQTLEVEDGAFAAKSLRPGTYSVEFYEWHIGGGGKDPLLVVENVVVNPGEVTRDPRLQAVELGRLLKTRIVTVVDERSRPLEGAKVGARRADSGFATFATGPNGQVIVATPESVVELVVAIKGYCSATVPRVTGDVTVTLKKASPKRVVIRLEEGVDLPPPPHYLAADLQWIGETASGATAYLDPRNDAIDSVRFGPDRTATVMVDTPGTYAVQLWLYEQSARGTTGTDIGPDEAKRATVVVGDDGTATVSVSLDAQELARRIKKG